MQHQMNGQYRRTNWRGSRRKLSWPSLRCHSGIWLEGMRKTMKTSVRIVGVLAKIQTEQLPNTGSTTASAILLGENLYGPCFVQCIIFFWEEIRIHNLLTKLEEKRLKWYGHLKRLDRTRTLRTSELKFKGKRPTGQPKTREFNQVLQDIKKSENSWKSYWKGKTVKR